MFLEKFNVVIINNNFAIIATKNSSITTISKYIVSLDAANDMILIKYLFNTCRYIPLVKIFIVDNNIIETIKMVEKLMLMLKR